MLPLNTDLPAAPNSNNGMFRRSSDVSGGVLERSSPQGASAVPVRVGAVDVDIPCSLLEPLMMDLDLDDVDGLSAGAFAPLVAPTPPPPPLGSTELQIQPTDSKELNPELFICRWADCVEPGFEDVSHLGAHIHELHIKPQKLANRRARVIGARCLWTDCTRTKDKPFPSYHALEIHIRFFHTRERPFLCDFPGCSFAFHQASDLKSHKTSHIKDKRKSSSSFSKEIALAEPVGLAVGRRASEPAGLAASRTLSPKSSAMALRSSSMIDPGHNNSPSASATEDNFDPWGFECE